MQAGVLSTFSTSSSIRTTPPTARRPLFANRYSPITSRRRPRRRSSARGDPSIVDGAAADDVLTIVEDQRLARRDRPLRLVEDHACPGSRLGVHGGRYELGAVANPREGPQRLGWLG